MPGIALRMRNAAASVDYRAWAGRLFADVGLDYLLVDEGGALPRITLQELGEIAPVHLRRVARSDNFIRDLLRPVFVLVGAGAAVLTVLGLIHGREADFPALGRTPEYVGHRGSPYPPVRNLVSRTLLHWPPHDCTI